MPRTLPLISLATGTFLVALAITTPVVRAQTAAYLGQPLGGGFQTPFGAAVDTSGNVYVTDGSAVKEIPAGCTTASCVTTLGGGFSTPQGIAVDTNGNVYVADTQNGAVKEIPSGCTSASCVISLGGGFYFPGGVAVDASGNVFVADTSNDSFKQMPSGCTSSNCVTTFAGAFNYPAGAAVDANGNIYVAENYSVQKLQPGCTSSSCATAVGGGFVSPQSLAVDASGNVYVADSGNGAVKQIPTGCTSSNCVITLGGGFAAPKGVAVDVIGNIYVADTSNQAVKQLTRQAITFPNTTVGSTNTKTLTFTIYSPGTIGAPVVLTQGNPGLDFTDAGTGTCTTNGVSYPYPANATCTVVVLFAPKSANVPPGTVQLVDNSSNILTTVSLNGTGIGNNPPPAVIPITVTATTLTVAAGTADNTSIAQLITSYLAPGYSTQQIEAALSHAEFGVTISGNGYTQNYPIFYYGAFVGANLLPAVPINAPATIYTLTPYLTGPGASGFAFTEIPGSITITPAIAKQSLSITAANITVHVGATPTQTVAQLMASYSAPGLTGSQLAADFSNCEVGFTVAGPGFSQKIPLFSYGTYFGAHLLQQVPTGAPTGSFTLTPYINGPGATNFTFTETPGSLTIANP
jgi:sugar lactone lactonase YvrE